MPLEECVICFNEASLRTVLPCDHWLCSTCYESQANGSTIECPFDRRKFPKSSGREIGPIYVLPNEVPPTVIPRPPAPNPRPIVTVTPPHRRFQREHTPPHTPRMPYESDSILGRLQSRLQSNIGRQMDNDYKQHSIVAVAVLLVITICRLIAGSTKLVSPCDEESDVAVYLFVKSWFGAVLWISILVLLILEHMERSLENLFFNIYLVLENSFALIWLIIGSAWTLHDIKGLKDDCKAAYMDDDFNESFINFAIFLTVLDWFLFTTFLVGFAFIMCESESD